MTKEIEEKVREQARQWFISSDMNVKDFALSVAKYVYEITTATQPVDVQERAKVNTNRGHSTNDNVRESKVPESDAAHLAGASSLQAENERLREALEKIGNLKRHELDLGESWYNRLTDATSTAKQALTKQ